MPRARFSPDGPEPPLVAGESLECLDCREVVGQHDSLRITDEGRDLTECFHCGGHKGFIRHGPRRTSVVDRWGAGAEAGWAMLPRLLIRHARIFNLGVTQIGVLLLLEDYWQDGVIRVEYKWLHEQVDVGYSTIQRTVNDLAERGLIEKRRITRGHKNAGWEITRHGLTRAVELINSNRLEGLPLDSGVAELLSALSVRPTDDHRSERPTPTGQIDRMQEEVGEEGREEPLRGAEYRDLRPAPDPELLKEFAPRPKLRLV